MASDGYLHTDNGSIGTRRGVIRHRSRELEGLKVLEATPSSPVADVGMRSSGRPQAANGGALDSNLLMGLTIAGMASTLLTTAYSMFHVDVFLRVYSLPLQSYSWGSLVGSLINTANDLAGAWVIDYAATTRSRSDFVGVAGCIFALCFVTPFFRWRAESSWDASHFIFSVSLYDTLYSFVQILMGSVVNDNHHITDQTRVHYMASGKAANLVASFIVARLGLTIFDVENLMRFRIFITSLAMVAAILFVVAQRMVSRPAKQQSSSTPVNRQGFAAWLFPQRHWHDDSDDYAFENTGPPPKLRWRQVVADFSTHKNFMAWIGMEVMLEAQYKFIINFLKTFVDGLVLQDDDGMPMRGMGRRQCDLFLSMVRPMTLIVGILVYIPIQKYSYPQVYRMLFYWNIFFAIATISLVNLDDEHNNSVYWIIIYLFLYPVITGAVRSAGFHLAQADMVLEMKRKHALEDRRDEPSLAGIFLGVNLVFCKPCESILPITAAQTLQRYGSSKTSLFFLLVVPPIVCSALQLVAWRRYDLTPSRTAKMRDELRSYHERECRLALELPKSPLSPYFE